MSNESNRVQVSLSKVLGSRPFGRGFADYRAGRPFRDDLFYRLNDQWAYERGRMFAALYQGSLRSNRRLAWDAIQAAREALHNGALI